MKISLIRHGPSKLMDNQPMTCQEFKNWMKNYALHGVFPEKTYPPETLKRMITSNIILTSNLKRALESAHCLKPNTVTTSNPLFREAELPFPKRTIWD